jgi:hypothetical protein
MNADDLDKYLALAAAMRARAAAATPGPWQRSRFVELPQYKHWTEEQKAKARAIEAQTIRGPGHIGSPYCNVVIVFQGVIREADKSFIAREDVPAAAAAIEALVAEVKALGKAGVDA